MRLILLNPTILKCPCNTRGSYCETIFILEEIDGKERSDKMNVDFLIDNMLINLINLL